MEAVGRSRGKIPILDLPRPPAIGAALGGSIVERRRSATAGGEIYHDGKGIFSG